VNFQAGVCPTANPLAVVQIGAGRGAVPHVGLVVAAAGAKRARPAAAAIGLVRDGMALQKRSPRASINSIADTPQLVCVRSGESMAERDVAVGRDAQQSQTCAARIRLAHPLVNLLEGVFDVRESMVPV